MEIPAVARRWILWRAPRFGRKIFRAKMRCRTIAATLSRELFSDFSDRVAPQRGRRTPAAGFGRFA